MREGAGVHGPAFYHYWSALRSGFTKVSRNAVAIGLARAVLDHIHYQLYDQDTRIAGILANDAEKVLAVENGEAKTFFQNLAETEKSVTCEDIGALSPYFHRINDLTKSGAFGITPENDIDLYNQLKTYRCSVDVYFSTPTDLLDSDVDAVNVATPTHTHFVWRTRQFW